MKIRKRTKRATKRIMNQILGIGFVPAEEESSSKETIRMGFHHPLQGGWVFFPEETEESGVVFDHGPFYYLSNIPGQKGSIQFPQNVRASVCAGSDF